MAQNLMVASQNAVPHIKTHILREFSNTTLSTSLGRKQ
jgi:hypothetical protein